MKLKNIHIRERLLAGYGLSAAACILLLIFMLFSERSIMKGYEHIINDRVEVQQDILNTRIYTNTAARYVRDMVLDTGKQNYAENRQKLEQTLDSLTQAENRISVNYPTVIGDGQETAYLEKIADWAGVVPEILNLLDSNNFEGARLKLVNECTPALQTLSNQASQLTSTIETQNQDMINRQNGAAVRGMVFVAAAAILLIAVEILFAFKVIASLVNPIDQVEYALIQMSKGELDAPVDYEGGDEVGQMAAALRECQNVLNAAIEEISMVAGQMADGNFAVRLNGRYPGELQSIPENIHKMLERLSHSINGMKEMAGHISDSSQQVAAGAQSQAQGATEQASSVEELSATLSSISVSAKQNTESAMTAKENMDKAGKQNRISREKMDEMMKAMDRIISTSQEIRKINKTIEDIAFQTNILALNAAVEAARAGNAGKGFAVVADEVKNLAGKSAEASKDTTALIEDSIQAVKNGSEIAQVVLQSIESSDTLSSETEKQMSQIADAVQRESEAIAQITEGIEQISTVVQTSSATSQESAAVSQELSEQAKKIRELVEGFITDGPAQSKGDNAFWQEEKSGRGDAADGRFGISA